MKNKRFCPNMLSLLGGSSVRLQKENKIRCSETIAKSVPNMGLHTYFVFYNNMFLGTN